ncbi:MAG: beta-ketoacyl-[acyl-carrier-protein] synthase family protein [Gemmatimonadetes bacterium]|nr:beta-ketoacyl-[acyl-carrier-protein] synthase family protein [Gemmatimonadota bacterium]
MLDNGNDSGNGRYHRVAVTGIGPITAVGTGAEPFWAGLRRERSPVRRITRFDASVWRSKIAAEIDDFEASDYMDIKLARRLDRFCHFSIAATRLAIEDAALDTSRVDLDRVAVQMGSALGGSANAEVQAGTLYGGNIRGLDPRVALTTFVGAASCSVAIEFGFTGPNSTNAMSCASGTIAVGEGFRLIRDGSVDIAIAGGIEAPLAPLCFGAFALIRAMSTRNADPEHACRPFDSGRDGFIMGEGACALVLERWDHAVERGARIYAEVAGYGTTNDAFHMAAPKPDGSQAARAMSIALRSADLSAADIDFVSPHGSSTPLNDTTETQAIKTVLGERAYQIPISGSKPYHAHALGASGAIEAAICCLAMHREWLPPTLNHDAHDDDCDLDYVPNYGRNMAPRNALSNSFGFGGINAALVLKRA